MNTDEVMKLSVKDRANLWILYGETGISSKTIWAVCMGVPVQKNPFEASWCSYFDAPHDSVDFRRCYLLLQLIPEWKKRLKEVAEQCPAWLAFAKNWDELTYLYEQERNNEDGFTPCLCTRISQLRR